MKVHKQITKAAPYAHSYIDNPEYGIEHAYNTGDEHVLYQVEHPSTNPGRAVASAVVWHPGVSGTMLIYPQNNERLNQWHARYESKGQEAPLFEMRENNFPAHVITLKSNKGGRVSAMTMLGVAELDAMRKGQTLTNVTKDANLSKHSSRLVEKLTGQSISPRNDWDFDTQDLGGIERESEEVGAADVNAGRAIIRNAVRRPRNLGPQFQGKQLKIPGIEG